MYQIRGKIEGVADILFNAFTPESEDNLRKNKTGGKFTDKQRTEEAMHKLHRNSEGRVIVPGWMFKACLVEGSAKGNLKEGRKALGPFLVATVFATGNMEIEPNEPDYVHEVPGKRPPKRGGACIIKRPAFKAGWQVPFVLTVVDDRRDVDQIRRCLEEGGLLAGMGSWRPEYGRFIVTEWNVKREEK